MWPLPPVLERPSTKKQLTKWWKPHSPPLAEEVTVGLRENNVVHVVFQSPSESRSRGCVFLRAPPQPNMKLTRERRRRERENFGGFGFRKLKNYPKLEAN